MPTYSANEIQTFCFNLNAKCPTKVLIRSFFVCTRYTKYKYQYSMITIGNPLLTTNNKKTTPQHWNTIGGGDKKGIFSGIFLLRRGRFY